MQDHILAVNRCTGQCLLCANVEGGLCHATALPHTGGAFANRLLRTPKPSSDKFLSHDSYRDLNRPGSPMFQAGWIKEPPLIESVPPKYRGNLRVLLLQVPPRRLLVACGSDVVSERRKRSLRVLDGVIDRRVGGEPYWSAVRPASKQRS